MRAGARYGIQTDAPPQDITRAPTCPSLNNNGFVVVVVVVVVVLWGVVVEIEDDEDGYTSRSQEAMKREEEEKEKERWKGRVLIPARRRSSLLHAPLG